LQRNGSIEQGSHAAPIACDGQALASAAWDLAAPSAPMPRIANVISMALRRKRGISNMADLS
jgi:hypothetical protein